MSQNYQVVHPYRDFDLSSTAIAQDFSTFFFPVINGHIYQWDYENPVSFIDRFRLYPEDKIGEAGGALLYDSPRNKLIVGSSWGSRIFIFEDASLKNPEKVLPDITIDVNKKTDANIGYMYWPKKFGDYIYWGCYHYDISGNAKIIRMNIHDYSLKVIAFENEVANYTQSLCIIDTILFAGTENGHIVKYNLRSQKLMDDLVNLKSNRKVYYMETDGNDLFVMMNSGSNPLYIIRRPSEHKPEVFNVVQNNTNYQPSRIFYSSQNNMLFMDKYKYDNQQNVLIPVSYDTGKLFGGFSLRGQDYFLGFSNAFPDDTSRIRRLHLVDLTTEQMKRHSVKSIKSHAIGSNVQTIEASNDGWLYMSTYWTSFVYKINNNQIRMVKDDNRIIREQADVIKAYNNHLIFGCYGGERPAILKTFDSNLEKWTTQEFTLGKNYSPRITSIGIDELRRRVILGSGEQTINKSTEGAILAYFSLDSINKNDKSLQNVNYSEKDLNYPVRFTGLEIVENYLFTVSYNKNRYTTVGKIQLGDFSVSETIDLGKVQSPFLFHYKIINMDNNYLYIGIDQTLNIYELDNISLSNPNKIINFDKDDIIVGIVPKNDKILIGFENRIEVYSSDLEREKVFKIDDSFDTITSIEIMDDTYYAATKLGRLYSFK